MRFLDRLNPVPGVQDFWSEFSRPNPYRIPVLLVSFLITGTILFAFTQEKVVLPPRSPEVTYITTFEPGRSDEQIVASNEANQERQDAIQAELERRAERRREMYRALGQATGIDTDAMEAEAAEERAREETAAQERARRMLGDDTATTEAAE